MGSTSKRCLRFCAALLAAWLGLRLVLPLMYPFLLGTLLALGVYPIIPDLSWTFVYAAALSGALLAIRSRTAYIAFLMGLCVISALIVFRSNSFFSV